jgi:hypothetical protein
MIGLNSRGPSKIHHVLGYGLWDTGLPYLNSTGMHFMIDTNVLHECTFLSNDINVIWITLASNRHYFNLRFAFILLSFLP